MARRKGRAKAKGRKGRRGRRVAGGTGPRASRGIGSLIASGVKNILSYLPGAPLLQNIADFGFKALGITKAELAVNQSYTNVSTSFYGMGARFCINCVPLLLGSSVGCRGVNTTGKPIVRVDFSDVRVAELIIRLNPLGEQAKRGGEWSLGWSPYYDREDHLRMMAGKASVHVPSDVDVSIAPYMVQGPANRPLVLRWRPRPHDSFANDFHPLPIQQRESWLSAATWLGCVSINFLEANRVVYTPMTAADFSASVLISGKFETRRGDDTSLSSSAGVHGGQEFSMSDGVLDCLRTTACSVIHSSGYLSFKNGTTISGASDGASSLVTGLTYEGQQNLQLTLDGMAIE